MPVFGLSASALTTFMPVNACNWAVGATSVPIPDRLESGVKDGGGSVPASLLDPGWKAPVSGPESHRFAAGIRAGQECSLMRIRPGGGANDAEMSLSRL